MQTQKLLRSIKIIAAIFFLFLANFRIFIVSPPRAYTCIFDGLITPEHCFVDGVGIETLLWIVLGVFFLLPLRETVIRERFLSYWGRNKLLVTFLLFALFSLFWTLFLAGSLRNLIVLIAVTLVVSAWVASESNGELLNWLAWFVAIMAALTFWLALAFPDIGRANFYPYDGAWRGIFRNRNYLGSFMAFGNMLFLLRLLSGSWEKRLSLLLNALPYFLSLGLVFLTKSATAGILVVGLHFFTGIIWLWLRLAKHLKRQHYYAFAAAGALGSVFFFLKLDVFFGFFNRSTSLTGRTSLWQYLLQDWVSKKPMLGYGYGAVWYSSLKYQAQRAVGWPFLIHIGDSGFMDILLNLGWIGLGLLVMILLVGAWRALRFALKEKTITSFFPLLTIIYVVLTNITLSYFMELEVYVWALLVMALFWVTPNLSSKTPSATQRVD